MKKLLISLLFLSGCSYLPPIFGGVDCEKDCSVICDEGCRENCEDLCPDRPQYPVPDLPTDEEELFPEEEG